MIELGNAILFSSKFVLQWLCKQRNACGPSIRIPCNAGRIQSCFLVQTKSGLSRFCGHFWFSLISQSKELSIICCSCSVDKVRCWLTDKLIPEIERKALLLILERLRQNTGRWSVTRWSCFLKLTPEFYRLCGDFHHLRLKPVRVNQEVSIN
jgi:hypothetical protein